MAMSITTQEAAEVIAHIGNVNPKQAIYLEGSPGVGKTAVALASAAEREIPADRITVFRPSLHDPVDLMGLPTVVDGVSRFAVSDLMHKFRPGTGPGLLVLDELAQAIPMMQNACGGLLLDRCIGEHRLDPAVQLIATGNRSEDKANSGRLGSHIYNRMLHLIVEPSLDDWCNWAFQNNVRTDVIAYLRFARTAGNEFDANQKQNSTYRTWHMVSDSITDATPDNLVAAIAQGLVGERRAVEFCAFRKVITKMPSIDGILIDPDGSPVPNEPEIRYAVSTALVNRNTDKNFDLEMQYMKRMPAEFQVMFVKDCKTKNPGIVATKAFTEFAVKNASVFTS